jgi:hypothetical protein
MNADAPVSHSSVEIVFANGDNYSSARSALSAGGKQNTIFSFRSPYRYNSELKIRETRATTEIRLNNYGAGDASSLDAKMEENYRRLQAMVNRHMQDHDVKPSEARAKIIGDLNSSLKKCLDLEIAGVGNVEASEG